MPMISAERLREYRADTFRTRAGRRVTTKEEAISFVDERGFAYFWPIKEITLPNLWTAVAGDRPVPDEHDDPGHITWGWKDELLGARRWYYAKVLRRRATLISLSVVPYFYALSENYGEPAEDYLRQYREGRLTYEAKAVYEALLKEGPLDTIALRQAARLTSPASNAPFSRAVDSLQADFKILPVGIAEAGAWRYAFIYNIVARHYPDLPELARVIRQSEARQKLAELHLRSVGAVQRRDLSLLFGWKHDDLDAAIAALTESSTAVVELQVEGSAGTWIGLAELL